MKRTADFDTIIVEKNGILRITCLSVHVSTCLMTFTLKKWRYSGWKTLKWRPRVTFKSSVKGNYGISQIALLEVYFSFNFRFLTFCSCKVS